MSRGKIIGGIIGLAILIALLFSLRSMFQYVSADEICVIQDPIDGEFHVYTAPGLYWQNFGTVTSYKKEFQYWFSSAEDQGSEADQSIKCRFNDGGHANISGSVRIKLPMTPELVIKMHTLFGSQEAVEKQMIRPLIEKSIYLTGPLMSSKESYADKRNDLLFYIEDQITNGVYKTKSKDVKEPDPVTGEMKTVTKVEVVKDTTAGTYARNEKSPLTQYGITVYNLSLNEIKYDATVEKQIAEQQQIIMDVQTAIADAKKAEQNAIKAEKEGEAKAMKSKWEQEVIKAKAVTEAEQKVEVAKQAYLEAEYYKKEQLLRADADATYKKLVMAADGGLTQKLEAYQTIMLKYAEMLGTYKGNWVPSIIVGGDNKNNSYSNSAEMLFQAMGIKTMKDLSLDMTVTGKTTK